MKYLIVDTDNFGSDYPNEKFVGEPFETKEAAERTAKELNGDNMYSARYYKVVEEGYKLRPGFEP